MNVGAAHFAKNYRYISEYFEREENIKYLIVLSVSVVVSKSSVLESVISPASVVVSVVGGVSEA